LRYAKAHGAQAYDADDVHLPVNSGLRFS
jgi:hypothetical protein